MVINRRFKIENASQIAKILTLYFQKTYAATAYNGWDVKQDNHFAISDLFVSCAISGRPNPFDRAYLKIFNDDKKHEIEIALSKIPVNSDLNIADLGDAQLVENVQNLFQATVGDGIGMPVATKLLHKKRPKLIPILDGLIVKNYWGKTYRDFYPITPRRTRQNSTLGLIDLIQTDLRKNYQLLLDGKKLFIEESADNFRNKWKPANTIKSSLTALRILDIAVWYGMYFSRIFRREVLQNE